jgi:hypothetical protein
MLMAQVSRLVTATMVTQAFAGDIQRRARGMQQSEVRGEERLLPNPADTGNHTGLLPNS